MPSEDVGMAPAVTAYRISGYKWSLVDMLYFEHKPCEQMNTRFPH